jgi:hypothetical protein
MSTLATSMPSDLSYLFDTNRFASLQGRIRGSRARKLATPPESTLALMSTPVTVTRMIPVRDSSHPRNLPLYLKIWSLS